MTSPRVVWSRSGRGTRSRLRGQPTTTRERKASRKEPAAQIRYERVQDASRRSWPVWIGETSRRRALRRIRRRRCRRVSAGHAVLGQREGNTLGAFATDDRAEARAL